MDYTATYAGRVRPDIDIDSLTYLQPGFTHIWNLKLEFGKQGFGNKTTFGECRECKKLLPVWQRCSLCSAISLSNDGRNIYTICMACPLPSHQRDLLTNIQQNIEPWQQSGIIC
ncbi:hypothetical protein TSAR_001250 [Trichomalopsis sarcophagae]|uniref:Uncharacterized protein n=1 Tax=Trichomalopsis sarcophagae TaxID=543379 RepID=A0A232EM08_9HYME|nr:hypothetical protein TSAR_001250 [Trichomalopsis sarcophagae]